MDAQEVLDLCESSSPPPASPPSPPSPPRIHFVRALNPIVFSRPVRPLMPELTPGFVDYYLPDTFLHPTDFHTELSLQQVKALILNPLLMPEAANHLMMVANSEFRTAYVPQLMDATHLPPLLRIFLKWFLRKEVVQENEDRELMMTLGPWIDPAPLLPLVRTIVLVRNHAATMAVMSNTDGVLCGRLHRPMKQLGIAVSWVVGNGRRNPREAEVVMWPHMRMWTCPATGVEADPWEVGNEELLKMLLGKPNLHKGMTFLFWNVRGLGRPSFKPNFRLLMHHHYPSFVILAETWVGRNKVADIVAGLGFDSWHYVEPVGFVGGLLLLWKSHIIDFQVIGEGIQGVYGVVEVLSSKTSFVLSSIYASTKLHVRKQLWQELENFAMNLNQPWLVLGDFNEILNQSEKLGGKPISRSRADLYATTMDNCNLVDLGFNGPKFTWTNKRRRQPIFERLDRGWANLEWLNRFPNANLWHLPRITSDHCPILLNLDHAPDRQGIRPFRFEPMWVLHESFLDEVSRSWPKESDDIQDSLDILKANLSVWNRNTFGNIFKRKNTLLARLKGTQNYLESNPYSVFHQNLEDELQKELMLALDQEELFWKTKSRLERISEGERNTRFFHRSVVIKRHSSRILSLRDDVGNDIQDPDGIRLHVRSFYERLYSSDQVQCMTQATKSDSLVQVGGHPSREEIKQALFSMKPLKSPGPDGFHPIFFQKAWEITGDAICQNIQRWFAECNIPEDLCQALICLIPKQTSPETIKQFRPISLCNTMYKLVTKILVNRLKPLIPAWISQNQNSFIKGRGPDINLVVASEVLHSMNKKRGKWGWFALKIDLEKAYDRIEWAFVKECLEDQNLDTRSVNLIMDCVSKASSSILINGYKTERFLHSRGLRQGDPMSPYLFNICLERLTQMINVACLGKQWTPFWVGRKKVPISHLLFADDLLLFGRVDEATAFTVRQVLEDFCLASGQKINEAKSKLVFSPNTPNECRELFQETLNVKESVDLGTYLGLPISHKRPSRSQVQFVVEKVRTKLAKWQTKYLSKAGRLCLISSTLSAIPAYYMQASCLPTQTLKDLDRVCNNFLWGEEQNQKKIHLVNRQTTFRPKDQGGLGIRNQVLMNKIYMAKLGWKMAQDKPSLAQDCIKSKYIREDHVTAFKNGSPIWQNIGKGWDLLRENSTWSLGNGERISFWFDDWLSIGPIRGWVQGPLSIEEENRKVKSVCTVETWNLDSISPPIPVHVRHRILSLPPPLASAREDLLIPTFVNQSKFSLGMAYRACLPPLDSDSDLRWIWKGQSEPKIKFFIWLVWHDKLPHKKCLHTRRIVQSPSCPRCQGPIEDSHHILRACPRIANIWLIPETPPQTALNLPDWLYLNMTSNAVFRGLPWAAVFPYICHEIWKDRNQCVFKKTGPSPVQVISVRATGLARELVLSTQTIPSNVRPSYRFSHPPGFHMIHVDASFIGLNDVAGLGGIVRDSGGSWVLGFGKSVYTSDSLTAEILAILEAIYISQTHAFTKVVIYSDCQVAIDIMLQREQDDRFANMVDIFRQWFRRDPNRKLRYCSREVNKVADALAKECRQRILECAVTRTFPSPPSTCMQHLVTDCMLFEQSLSNE